MLFDPIPMPAPEKPGFPRLQDGKGQRCRVYTMCVRYIVSPAFNIVQMAWVAGLGKRLRVLVGQAFRRAHRPWRHLWVLHQTRPERQQTLDLPHEHLGS